MATLIPVSGELVTFDTPFQKSDLDKLIREDNAALYGPHKTRRREWKSSSGEMFIFHGDSPSYVYPRNPRATLWVEKRGGSVKVEGTAIFLSTEEWGKLEARAILALTQALIPMEFNPYVTRTGEKLLIQKNEESAERIAAQMEGEPSQVPLEAEDKDLEMEIAVVTERILKPEPVKVVGSCFICGTTIFRVPGDGEYVTDRQNRKILQCSNRLECTTSSDVIAGLMVRNAVRRGGL